MAEIPEKPAYDVLEVAEEVAAAEAERVGMPRTTFYPFETRYTARRALLLSTIFPKAKAAPTGWVARIHGTDRQWGLARTFLPKTYRVLGDGCEEVARDCSEVRAGDVLECRRDATSYGYKGHVHRGPERFLRIVAATDAGVTAEKMGEDEVAALYHGERR